MRKFEEIIKEIEELRVQAEEAHLEEWKEANVDAVARYDEACAEHAEQWELASSGDDEDYNADEWMRSVPDIKDFGYEKS